MLKNKLIGLRDFLHAEFCYQLFVTPIPLKPPPEYLEFTSRACDFVAYKRSNKLEFKSPRHYVVHHFAQTAVENPKKVLITHGWTSRAAYMVRTIRVLQQQGYEVYALDFPAHGEAHGLQLRWVEAVLILRNVFNELGPFYAAIGHSFGGSMLLNLLNLASQLPEWKLEHTPERMVLMASPTRMRTPITHMARRTNLSEQGYAWFCQAVRKRSIVDIKHLHYRHFIERVQTPVLCIHGQDDQIIDVKESILFCRKYPYASLALVPNVDHIGVLVDKRIENMISNFLSPF